MCGRFTQRYTWTEVHTFTAVQRHSQAIKRNKEAT